MLQVLGRLRSLFGEDLVLSLLKPLATKEQIRSFQYDDFQLFCCITVIIITSAAPADVIFVTWESDHQLWVGKSLEGGCSVSVNRHSFCTLFQVMQSQTYTILE